MIRAHHIATALLLTSIAAAHAETNNQPVAQGSASVERNLSGNADNKGLKNASEQLKENEVKIDAKRSDCCLRGADYPVCANLTTQSDIAYFTYESTYYCGIA